MANTLETATTEQRAYDWQEDDWFRERDAPGYGDSDEAELRGEFGEGDDWGSAHDFRTGTDKHEWLAFRILKQTGRVLCATTLFDTPNLIGGRDAQLCAWLFDGEQLEHDPDAVHHENRAVELSDPEVVVPKTASEQWGAVAYGGADRRVNPETGYLSGGESTACVVADRPLPAFMQVVETVLVLAATAPAQTREVRRYAEQLKREGDLRDRDILARVLAAVDT